MAQGDIISFTVNSTGYQAEIEIEGMGVSGSINSGFPDFENTLFTSSNPTLTMTVYSKGFTDNGGFTYITRSLVGTKFVRMPSPYEAFADHRITGSNVVVKINLSDFIYSEDTGSVSISASYYTSASINSNTISNLSINNSSVVNYPKVIGNWYWPCWDIATGSHYRLRMGAFHRSAEQGRPVRFVKFTGKDNSGNTVSDIVLNATVDTGMRDAVPVVEYVYDMPLSTLTQGQLITCSFAAYPWYGNSGSILDTSLSQFTHSMIGIGTPYYANTFFLNDKNNTYGQTICVVDPATGNDSTGVPVDSSSYNPSSPPAAFATIGKAASSASVYNNIRRGRNDVGNAIIYLKEGEYRWLGSANSYGTIPLTWCTVSAFSGSNRNLIKISGSSGNQDISDRVKVEGVNICHTGNGGLITGVRYLWIHNCELSASGNATIFGNNLAYATHNTVNLLGVGFRAFSGTTLHYSIIRGNWYRNPTTKYPTQYSFTCIGNLGNRDTASATIQDGDLFGINNYLPNLYSGSNVIFAYNAYYKARVIGDLAFSFYSTNNYASSEEFHGCAIVQNLLEQIESTGTNILWVGADANPGKYIHNVVAWHNVLIGQRQNWGYNDSGSSPKYKINWQSKNNLADDSNSKTDTFTGYGPADGNRTGNWSIMNGVGHKGNFFGNVAGIGAAKIMEFCGINSVHKGSGYPYSASFLQYIDRQASPSPDLDGSGSGDYRLAESSPIISVGSDKFDWVLPYDLAGNVRTANSNYAGAYAFSSPATFVNYVAGIYSGFFVGN